MSGGTISPYTKPHVPDVGAPREHSGNRTGWAPVGERHLRVVLADDAVLLREGIAQLLEAYGIHVVAQAGDASELLRCVATAAPDLTITDIRMPPTKTLEGLVAAERIRAEHPSVGVLLLSQHVDAWYAERVLALGAGVGYLLKHRVSDVDEFVDSVRRVAAGETILDPDLTGHLPDNARRVRPTPT